MAFRQRKKGAPITYDAQDDPIPLPWARQKNSRLPWPPAELRLKITASPNDWETLYIMSQATPELLGLLIFKHIAEPVYERFLIRETHPLPRGVHAEPEDSEDKYALGKRQLFMWQARCYAAAAYTVIRSWKKRSREEWPEHLIDMESKYCQSHSVKKPTTIELTKFCFDQKFGKIRSSLGMKQIDEDSFRKIYLLPEFLRRSRKIYEVIKLFEQNITIEELYEKMI